MKYRSRLTVTIVLCVASLSIAKAVLAEKHPSEKIPSSIEECEQRGHERICSTWKWNGKEFDATWPDGSIGKMTPGFIVYHGEFPSDEHVVFMRVDQTGTSAGLSTAYQCQLHHGKVVNGWYMYKVGNRSTMEKWTGTFIY